MKRLSSQISWFIKLTGYKSYQTNWTFYISRRAHATYLGTYKWITEDSLESLSHQIVGNLKRHGGF